MTTTVPSELIQKPYRKNLMINGSLQVNQRGWSSAAATSLGVYFPADRFWYYNDIGGATAPTLSRDTDVPTREQCGVDLSTSIKLLVNGTVASPTGLNESVFIYRMEGYDFAPHKGGDLTFSFWVKSNKTGTYSCSTKNTTSDRTFVREFTVDASATWERKIVTFPYGDETTGTWNSTNGNGAGFYIGMMTASGYHASSNDTWITTNDPYSANQTNLFDTASNYFMIAGLQIEKGDTATSLEVAPYHEDLAAGQRYYYRSAQVVNWPAPRYSLNTGVGYNVWQYPVPMRTTPTFTAGGTWVATSGFGGTPVANTITTTHATLKTTLSVAANGNLYIDSDSADGNLHFDAEL